MKDSNCHFIKVCAFSGNIILGYAKSNLRNLTIFVRIVRIKIISKWFEIRRFSNKVESHCFELHRILTLAHGKYFIMKKRNETRERMKKEQTKLISIHLS